VVLSPAIGGWHHQSRIAGRQGSYRAERRGRTRPAAGLHSAPAGWVVVGCGDDWRLRARNPKVTRWRAPVVGAAALVRHGGNQESGRALRRAGHRVPADMPQRCLSAPRALWGLLW
jgi:hypothetical protein